MVRTMLRPCVSRRSSRTATVHEADSSRKATISTTTAPTAPWIARVTGSGTHGRFWKAMTKVSR